MFIVAFHGTGLARDSEWLDLKQYGTIANMYQEGFPFTIIYKHCKRLFSCSSALLLFSIHTAPSYSPFPYYSSILWVCWGQRRGSGKLEAEHRGKKDHMAALSVMQTFFGSWTWGLVSIPCIYCMANQLNTQQNNHQGAYLPAFAISFPQWTYS